MLCSLQAVVLFQLGVSTTTVSALGRLVLPILVAKEDLTLLQAATCCELLSGEGKSF